MIFFSLIYFVSIEYFQIFFVDEMWGWGLTNKWETKNKQCSKYMIVSLFVFSGMRQNTVDTIPLCKNFLVYLVGPPKMTFFWRVWKKIRDWEGQQIDKKEKNNKFAKYKLKYIWWIISFFSYILSRYIKRGYYNRGHVYTRYIY